MCGSGLLGALHRAHLFVAPFTPKKRLQKGRVYINPSKSLLGAPGRTTRNKNATTSSSKDAIRLEAIALRVEAIASGFPKI